MHDQIDKYHNEQWHRDVELVTRMNIEYFMAIARHNRGDKRCLAQLRLMGLIETWDIVYER